VSLLIALVAAIGRAEGGAFLGVSRRSFRARCAARGILRDQGDQDAVAAATATTCFVGRQGFGDSIPEGTSRLPRDVAPGRGIGICTAAWRASTRKKARGAAPSSPRSPPANRRGRVDGRRISAGDEVPAQICCRATNSRQARRSAPFDSATARASVRVPRRLLQESFLLFLRAALLDRPVPKSVPRKGLGGQRAAHFAQGYRQTMQARPSPPNSLVGRLRPGQPYAAIFVQSRS